ncbi:MAG: hypothetical protein WBQ66_04300, partial [Blastocatellia bacterium]
MEFLRRVVPAMVVVAISAGATFAQEPVAGQDEGDDEDFPLPYVAPTHPTIGGYELTGTIELG